jgi:hypothetical protein
MSRLDDLAPSEERAVGAKIYQERGIETKPYVMVV